MKLLLNKAGLPMGPVDSVTFTTGDGTSRRYLAQSYTHSHQMWSDPSEPVSVEVYELDTLTGTQDNARAEFVNELLAKLPENYDDDASDESIVHTWVDDQLAGTDRSIVYARECLDEIRKNVASSDSSLGALVMLDELIAYLK
jgi:hypothetical protein